MRGSRMHAVSALLRAELVGVQNSVLYTSESHWHTLQDSESRQQMYLYPRDTHGKPSEIYLVQERRCGESSKDDSVSRCSGSCTLRDFGPVQERMLFTTLQISAVCQNQKLVHERNQWGPLQAVSRLDHQVYPSEKQDQRTRGKGLFAALSCALWIRELADC